MSSHWPLFLAIMVVSAAVAFGLYTQSESERKGKVDPVIKTLPKKYVPTIAVKQVNAAPAALVSRVGVPARNTRLGS